MLPKSRMDPDTRVIPMHPRARNALFAFILVGLSACEPFHESDFDRYQRARALWERSDSGAYNMTLSIGCGDCPYTPPLLVKVRDGRIASTQNAIDGTAISAVGVLTVDSIFDRIRDALRGQHGPIELEFHPQLGYPIRASLDPVAEFVDDEVFYGIESLMLVNVVYTSGSP